MLGGHPGPHRLPGHHLVDGDVLADVAEEVEQAQVAGPVPVVDQPRRVDDGERSTIRPIWALMAATLARQRLVVEQVALLGAPARVADHARGAAGQGDRPVPGVLEAAQHEQADQVADVQAVGGRVAAVVQRDRALGEPGRAARRGRCCPARGPGPRGRRAGRRSPRALSRAAHGSAGDHDRFGSVATVPARCHADPVATPTRRTEGLDRRPRPGGRRCPRDHPVLALDLQRRAPQAEPGLPRGPGVGRSGPRRPAPRTVDRIDALPPAPSSRDPRPSGPPWSTRRTTSSTRCSTTSRSDQPTGEERPGGRPALARRLAHLPRRPPGLRRPPAHRPRAQLLVDEKFSDSIETVIGTFAEVNKMGSCVVPGDVG